MQSLQSYGIKEFTQLSSTTDAYVEELRINGFAIVAGIIEEKQLTVFREKVDRIYEQQEQEVKQLGNLAEINDANVARSLLVYDESFLELSKQPLFLELAQKTLGSYFILQMQNAIISMPNQQNYQTAWHRDLNYQHFVATRPLAISILLCLDDFSKETGGTCVLPGTHKVEMFPSEEFVSKHTKQIICKAGSVLIMDAMLYHRAGNNSSGEKRRAINHMYCLPFIKQQISLPLMLAGKYADDPFLKQFLGYDSEPGASVNEWRMRKFKKLARVDVAQAVEI